MNFYELIGLGIGWFLVFVLILFFVTPFFIITALLNDKTYKNVKAQVNNKRNPWEVITNQNHHD
jgi:uncharacterized membrane protein